MKTLAEAGCETVVLGDEDSPEWYAFFERLGARYLTYPVQRAGVNPFQDFETLRHLTKCISKECPDVVFTYQAKANVYGCLAARIAGTRRIVSSVEGLGSILGKKRPFKKWVLSQILHWEYRVALSGVEKCFFVNRDDLDYFVGHRLLDRSKAVITNGVGVNLTEFPFSPIPGGAPVFLFVGRLIREKGIIEYLEAAKILKEQGVDASFHVLGGLDANPSAIGGENLKEYIDAGAVSYHGETDDVLPYLQSCSVFVLPSFYGEGLPKSALEAMSVGRPLIMTDVVGCRDLIREGVNGFLVQPRNADCLAKAMRRFCDDYALLGKMGGMSRKMAEDMYDVLEVNKIIMAQLVPEEDSNR